MAHEENTVVVSCEDDLNLDYLVETIWRKLNLMRVYTKKRGEYPDFSDGLIVRNGATIEHVCHAIHRSLTSNFRYALVWVSAIVYWLEGKLLIFFLRELQQNIILNVLASII